MNNPAPFPETPAPPPSSPSLTERFREIVEGLMIGMCNRREAPAAHPPLPDALVWVICGRLTRLCKRFASLVLRAARGPLHPARAQPQRAGQPRRAPGPPATPSPFGYFPSLPTRFGWFIRAAGTAGTVMACVLRELLADPEMAALVGVDPARFARLLRPLCHALGVDADAAGLAAPPPAMRAPRAQPVSRWPRPGFERAAAPRSAPAPARDPGSGEAGVPGLKTP